MNAVIPKTKKSAGGRAWALLAFLCCFGWEPVSEAATNVVIQGDDFQAAINAASSGDTLVVQSGSYSGNLSFTKPLTVVCSGSQIQLIGNTTISAGGTVSLFQTTFLGTVQIQTNTTVALSLDSFSNLVTSSGGNVQAVDSQFNGLNATGGKVTVKRCAFADGINLNNTPFEALRITNAANLTAVAPPGSTNGFVAVQSYFQAVSLTGCQAWLGYNSFTSSSAAAFNPVGLGDHTPLVYLNGCDTVFVGNLAYIYGGGGDVDDVFALGGSLKAHSNRIRSDSSGGAANGFLFYNNASGEAINNSMFLDATGASSTALATSGGTPGVPAVVVQANAIVASRAGAISDNNGSVSLCTYCCLSDGASSLISGVTATAFLYLDPQYVNVNTIGPLSATNNWLAPGLSSPCLNAGPPDAINNNTDGTRNTMGYTGGPLWNPANYTNNNPIVFWAMPSKQTVLKGRDTSIQLNAAAAAGY
jgi:hypothetical protein